VVKINLMMLAAGPHDLQKALTSHTKSGKRITSQLLKMEIL
jgi:hypothetical protein